MDETLLLLIISLFSSLVLVIVHFYLYLELRKKAFLIWGISWILYSSRYALALLLYTDRRNMLFLILYQFPILWSGYFLFFGTFNFMDTSISRIWITGPILGTLWILFFTFGIPIQIIELRDLIFLSLFPIFILLGSTNIYLGVIFIKMKGYDIAINKLTGFILILTGIHTSLFLLPRRLGILTTSNYILEIILKLLVAVSLLLLYTHKIRLDYLYSERLYIESEKKLIDSEEKFKVIVENAPDIIFIVDSNYRIRFINKTPEGIDPSDTLGKSCLDYVPKSYHSVVKKSINYVFKEHKPTSYETKARGQAGSIIWYSTRLAPIGHGKSVHSVLLITRDMTKQKNIEKQLRIMNTLKSELINRTSHELKTPLVSIKGFSELLLKKYKEDLDSDILSLIKEIKKGSRRLEKLVKDLFKTSKLEYGNLKLHKKKSNISELIREVLMQLREKIEARNHQIETNLESNLICEFDRENIKEVLINLINNAINYTPPNGKITIDSNLNGQNVIIKIIDTGIGIDNEDNANLFRYFGKVEHFGKGLDVITEGPGLGLYISKNIVQLHGGKLWFESEGKFKGTTFYFTLPC